MATRPCGWDVLIERDIEFLSVDLALVVAGWTVAWFLLWRLPGWGSSLGTGRARSVSVVIPARNEEQSLPRLLESVGHQVWPPDEIIVVDDQSTDRTAPAAGAFGSVHLLESVSLPEGWTGKCWACWQGARAARGDILVFVDADVELGPDALAHGVAAQRQRGGLVSVQPVHHIGSTVEMLSLPFNVVAVMGIGIGSMFPPRRQQAAAGPFMVCQRHDYALVDGHRSVRGEVVEDLALARRFTEAGLPATCLAGLSDVRFRMYHGGLRQIVEGWSKNFATGARFTPAHRALAIALWIAASLTATKVIAAAALGSGGVAVAVVVYAAFTFQYFVLGHRVGRFGPAAAGWPLLLAFFVIVFAWSLIATFVLRRVRWRDRRIPIRHGRRRSAGRTG